MRIPIPLEGLGGGIGAILLAIIGIVIIWAIVSLPVYIAARFVARGGASLGRAMLATFLGPVVYFFVLFMSSLVLREFGLLSSYLPIVIAFIAFLGVYKSIFNTGWVGAFGIAIIAIIILAIVLLIIGASFFGSLPVRDFAFA